MCIRDSGQIAQIGACHLDADDRLRSVRAEVFRRGVDDAGIDGRTAQPLSLIHICLLGLAGALPVLLGDNIGTTITAVLASLSASRDAKRVAAAHAGFNLTGAAVFCAGLPLYVRLTAALSPKGPELAVIARQIDIRDTGLR